MRRCARHLRGRTMPTLPYLIGDCYGCRLFSDIVASAENNIPSYTLDSDLAGFTTYYWRVTPGNACGTGPVSTTSTLRTVASAALCTPVRCPKPSILTTLNRVHRAGLMAHWTKTARIHGNYSSAAAIRFSPVIMLLTYWVERMNRFCCHQSAIPVEFRSRLHYNSSTSSVSKLFRPG